MGISLALAGNSITDYSLTVVMSAFSATGLGWSLAKRMTPSLGVRLEILGGLALLAIRRQSYGLEYSIF